MVLGGTLLLNRWETIGPTLESMSGKLFTRVSGLGPYDEYAKISTYFDLWTNGYFGLFFRFDQFGYLNLLAIPLLLHFTFKIRQRSRWETAIVLTYLLSSALIGWKGYYNFRYAFTFVPFMMAFVFAEGRYVFRMGKQKYFFYLLCAGLVLCSYYGQREMYWDLLRHSLVKRDWNLLPTKLVDYLNDDTKLPPGNILVCDQPWFYYYTSRTGVEYTGSMLSKLDESSNIKGTLNQLESMDIRYILVGPSVNRSSIGRYEGKYIGEIILKETIPIFEDRGVRLLWIGRNDETYINLYDSIFSGASLIKNGSFGDGDRGNQMPEFWHIHGSGNVQWESSVQRVGKSALKITGDNFNFYQKLPISGLFPKVITCFAWIKTDVPQKYRIEIYDGIGFSASERHRGDGTWQILRAIYTTNPKSSSLEIRVVQAEKTGNRNAVVYVDGVLLLAGEYYSPLAAVWERNPRLLLPGGRVESAGAEKHGKE